MRKTLLLPAAAVVAGVVGLLVRWLYLKNGFEMDTGLLVSGAPTMWVMLLVSVAVVVVLALLCRGKHQKFDQCYTGAFRPTGLLWTAGVLAGAVLLVVGGFLALAAWASSPLDDYGQRSMSVSWLLLGILALLAGAAGIEQPAHQHTLATSFEGEVRWAASGHFYFENSGSTVAERLLN